MGFVSENGMKESVTGIQSFCHHQSCDFAQFSLLISASASKPCIVVLKFDLVMPSEFVCFANTNGAYVLLPVAF